jgi:hypothetical protein
MLFCPPPRKRFMRLFFRLPPRAGPPPDNKLTNYFCRLKKVKKKKGREISAVTQLVK